MLREQAEIIAIQGLEWLAGDEDMLGAFLAASGADVNDLKKMATDSMFLGSVLDFILMDDGQIIRFCDTGKLEYDAPLQARLSLPGGEVVNWT